MGRKRGSVAAILSIGSRFGRYTVIAGPERHPGDPRRVCYRCRCECGEERLVRMDGLTSGDSSSCGCLNRERVSAAGLKHGMSRTRLYRLWVGMRNRCENPHEAHRWHHGKGVTVADVWMTFEPFRDWALANGYRDDLEIDRIDNALGYSPENCRWVDQKQQQANRDIPTFEAFGERKTLAAWAKDPRCKVGRCGLWKRVKMGVPLEAALLAPRQTYKKRDA